MANHISRMSRDEALRYIAGHISEVVILLQQEQPTKAALRLDELRRAIEASKDG